MDLLVLGFIGAAFLFFWVVYILYFWLPMARADVRESDEESARDAHVQREPHLLRRSQ